jgi:hypothetical protein
MFSTPSKEYSINSFGKAHKAGHKWALVNWKELCKPKHAGGLGLRDPQTLNQVLGEKIWWRWIKNPTEIWARL